MRITITADSATFEELRELLLAFRAATAAHELPTQITTGCTVSVAGSCFTVTTPAMTHIGARAMLHLALPVRVSAMADLAGAIDHP